MEAFIARQPILTVDNKVHAYELLFRSGPENLFRGRDANQASSTVISNSLSLFDLSSLTSGRDAYINMPRQLLVDGSVRLLPHDQVVIEILENVTPDEKVLEAVRSLKTAGYRFALDDIVSSEDQLPFVELADVIKVDWKAAGERRAAEIIKQWRRPGLRFLAEKVETWADFQRAEKLGFTLFQGYYFQRPEVLTHGDIPRNKAVALALFQAIRKDPIDFASLESLIKSDLSLSYRLLRLVNSAWAALPREILSISHAMVMLGEVRIRQLIQVTAMTDIAEDSVEELVQRSFIRASFMETLASRLGMSARDQEFYFVGFFSWLDVILGRTMDKVLELLPVGEEARVGLTTGEGLLGLLLKLCAAHEHGDWPKVERVCAELDLDAERTAEDYIHTIEHLDNFTKSINRERRFQPA
ncbi:MAG: HDOD domain-containing protein [Candidatus Krumholzibacteriia bacterium]|nr:HDOD domain-containing protein [Candidatus Latescibacterota bacterium]